MNLFKIMENISREQKKKWLEENRTKNIYEKISLFEVREPKPYLRRDIKESRIDLGRQCAFAIPTKVEPKKKRPMHGHDYS